MPPKAAQDPAQHIWLLGSSTFTDGEMLDGLRQYITLHGLYPAVDTVLGRCTGLPVSFEAHAFSPRHRPLC